MALSLEYERLSLVTRHPFGTSGGTRQRFENVIVRIREGELEGIGEGAPSAACGESVRTLMAALDRLRGRGPLDSGTLACAPTILDETLAGDRAARAAVDMALLDLEGKRCGLALGALLGIAARPLALTSYTIGIDAPEAMLRKAREASDFPLLKVKLGFRGDVEVVERIRNETGKRVIVDVNAGWSYPEARDKIARLAACGVEMVEQPVRSDDLDGLRALHELRLLPIVADESVAGPEDVRRLRDCVDGINVKLAKCGGVRPALRTMHEARALGMKVLLGCRIESSLACTAAAHLCALADWVDLDGPALIGNDPFEGMAIEHGRIRLPGRAGIGVRSRRAERRIATAPSRAELDWDDEWQRAWKAHSSNSWFLYQGDVLAAWVRERLAGVWSARVLKTDAFDEACGFRPLTVAAAGAQGVLMDISPRIVRHAASALEGDGESVAFCATDVRLLAFRPGSFDLVLSPSTLDHFHDDDEIGIALRELHAVLRPGGRLLITLDNPANPILRLRQAIYRLSGPVGGLIPFPMGRTLARASLVAVLEREGFHVLQSGYVVHAPRFLGLWAAEWAARRGRQRLSSWLHDCFARVERVLARLPTRRWTGWYVAADCSRPAVGRPRPVTRARGLARVIAWYRAVEHRARCAYLRRVPPAVLARVDAPLRRTVATARRALATPLYMRQELARWTGPCGDGTGTVVTWGKRPDVGRLFDVFFDGAPQVSWHGGRTLPAALRVPADLHEGADVFVAETTPTLARVFRRRGFFIVPAAVRFTGVPGALLAVQKAPSKSLRSDLTLIRHAGYRTEVWPYTRARSVAFYERYLIPYARDRFAARALLPDFDWSDRLFASGFALAILPPDGDEPDVLGVALAWGEVLSLARLGAKDADPAVLHRGGIAALYEFTIRLAHERGFRLVDFGQGRPWGADGVVRYKWKWGFRPVVDPAHTLEYAVRVMRPDSAAARRLGERQVIVRDGGGLRFLSPEDLAEPQGTTMPSRRICVRR